MPSQLHSLIYVIKDLYKTGDKGITSLIGGTKSSEITSTH